MIPLALAMRLRLAGLTWQPRSGDRFVLPGRGMDDEVFVLADMVADVHRFPGGPVIGFNGTVEWALDSVAQEEAVWLPGEDQLRELVGDRFRRLERVGDRYRVTLAAAEPAEPADPDDQADAGVDDRVDDRMDDAAHEEWTAEAPTAEEAYGRALLAHLTGTPSAG